MKYNSQFEKGEDITEEDSLKLAARAAQMNENDIDTCLRTMDNPETKEALKNTTEKAVHYGVGHLIKIVLKQ